MTISFNEITAGRVPSQQVEIDSSQASQGPALLAYRAILLGQKLAAGTGVANTLYRVTSENDVIALAGRGSMLHRQALGWFAKNTFTEVWIGILEDNGAGVAATGTITVTGPATEDGTIPLYLGGELVEVAVSDADTADEIATAIAAAINANTDLPVTAAAVAAVVTVTFRHKGLIGNYFDMRDNYRDGDALPAGVGLTFAAMASGTTAPVLTSLIAAMGDSWFQIWSHPYTDATSLTAIESELADRFGPARQIPGVAITSASGLFSALTTLGTGRNSPHSVIVAQPGINPLRLPGEYAAEVAALVALHGAADPARPFQTLGMDRALPPAEADRFTQAERDQLLYDGIATTKVGPGGKVQLERLITTYQLNAAGSPSTAYLDVTTMLTLLYLRYSWRARLEERYPRHKLANDGTRAGPGQPIMTPKLGRAEALGWFREMEALGLVENFDQFKRDLLAERNTSDPNQMDWRLPPDLVNQFIRGATQIAFRL